MSSVQTASLSDVGRKRRINQDYCGEFPLQDGALLLVCCDGMGGHQGGEIASQLAVEAIAEVFQAADAPPDQSLRMAFEEAHRRVQGQASERPELRGMGTTGVALYYDGNRRAWIANVGDSRAYRLRNGRIEQLTNDHSVLAELLRAGRISTEEAAQQPHNELSRAIGASPVLDVDTEIFEVEEGDRYLLCSDGLWNMVETGEIGESLRRKAPADAVRHLVDRANECGGTDNITVQVFALGAGEPVDEMESDATEVLSNSPPGATWTGSRIRAAETRVVSLEDVDVEEIWAKAQAEVRARRDRSIRYAIAGAVVLGVLLIGALVWLSSGSDGAGEGASGATDRVEVAP